MYKEKTTKSNEDQGKEKNRDKGRPGDKRQEKKRGREKRGGKGEKRQAKIKAGVTIL